jgi:hypothetical protein
MPKYVDTNDDCTYAGKRKTCFPSCRDAPCTSFALGTSSGTVPAIGSLGGGTAAGGGSVVAGGVVVVVVVAGGSGSDCAAASEGTDAAASSDARAHGRRRGQARRRVRSRARFVCVIIAISSSILESLVLDRRSSAPIDPEST